MSILNRQNILLAWFGDFFFLHILLVLKKKNKKINEKLLVIFLYYGCFKLQQIIFKKIKLRKIFFMIINGHKLLHH